MLPRSQNAPSDLLCTDTESGEREREIVRGEREISPTSTVPFVEDFAVFEIWKQEREVETVAFCKRKCRVSYLSCIACFNSVHLTFPDSNPCFRLSM
ncbi:hypothetical protein IMY05_009G0104000 [Salix suchowensis]|nr:hypothetical protein IMY05_009G0104000 [Salix suchowensis]